MGRRHHLAPKASFWRTWQLNPNGVPSLGIASDGPAADLIGRTIEARFCVLKNILTNAQVV
jgi:hypothetical protein